MQANKLKRKKERKNREKVPPANPHPPKNKGFLFTSAGAIKFYEEVKKRTQQRKPNLQNSACVEGRKKPVDGEDKNKGKS